MQNPLFQYDQNNQEKWMNIVKDFLIGGRWETLNLRDWA